MKKYFLCMLFLWGYAVVFAGDVPIDSEMRKNYIRRAQVWHPVDVASADIVAGPQNEIAPEPGAEVECTFVEPEGKVAGVQPKFQCKLNSGDVVRVKYGQATREIYAEAAASRLLWALGFFADEVYPAIIRCLNCPRDPSNPQQSPDRGTYLFEDAVIERNFPGVILQEKDDQGWAWHELDLVDESEGGAPRKHVDALKLLAVFLQHGDSKPPNQRVACYPENYHGKQGKDGYCSAPVLMIQDIGSTFGAGSGVVHTSKMDFQAWKSAELFDTAEEAKRLIEKNQQVCIGKIYGNIASAEDGLNHPLVNEEGRQFLADLLNQLTVQQIRDLFVVSRFERMENFVEEGEGVRRKVTVDDWTREFIRKRDEINNHRCIAGD